MSKLKLLNIFKKREKETETPLEFIATLISCWLITIGVCVIFDSFFYMQSTLPTIIIQTLVTIVITALLTRRWWYSFAFLGTIVLSVLTAALLNDTAYEVLKIFLSFVKWWANGLLVDSMWHSEFGFYLVHTFVNIGVTVLLFAVTRITKRAWVVVVLAVAVMVIAITTGYIDYNFWAIPFFVAGIFPLIASEKFRNKNLSNFKTLFGLSGEKWLFTVVSTAVAVAICLCSVTVVFTMGEDVRTRFFTDVVADIQTVTKAYTKEQKATRVSLYDMGLAENRSYVGGNIRRFSSATLAVTDLTEPAFVKIAAFDNFNGKNWKSTCDNAYRVNGPWDKQEEKYLSSTILEDSYFKKVVGSMAQQKKVTVCMSRDTHILPVLTQAYNFEEVTPNKNQILFDKNGRLFSYYGQETGFTYSFDTVLYNTKQESLGGHLSYIIPVYGNSKDPLYDPDGDFYKTFTQEYNNKPALVDQIISSMGFVTENYYDKAFRICELFSKENGFVYTDTPPQFKEGENIVEKLFETKRGHCVYYATAMISLTRAAGIPSRLAAGYRTISSSVTGTQVIDRSEPYAWVECYIPHIGWVNFDPTPNVKAVPAGQSGSSNNKNPDGSNLNPEGEEDSQDDELYSPGNALEWDGGPNVPRIIINVITVLLLLAVVLNTVFSQSSYKLKSVRRRFKDTRLQARYYQRDIMRQFMWLGFKLKKGETINELTLRTRLALNESYAKKVKAHINTVEDMHYGEANTNDAEKQSLLAAREALENVLANRNNNAFAIIDNGIKVIEAVYYGGITPTNEQIETIFNARCALEKEVKNRNNIIAYIFKRRMLLPIFSFHSKIKSKKK